MGTVEDLERRVGALEQEMAALRGWVKQSPGTETAAERGTRLLREAKASQAAISAGMERTFAKMGITGHAIGAERVQELIAASGVKPEDNAFSRGIIAMREE